MKTKFVLISVFLSASLLLGQNLPGSPRYTLDLCGEWDFDQTVEAFPPKEFTRKIPVPGLIDLAEPHIKQYRDLFFGDQDLRYSWYKCTFDIPENCKGKKAIFTILKSRFNTQVILNDIDLGTYMQCSTPIECNLTDYLNPSGVNILLIRVDDIRCLPIQSAYSKDIENFTYIPGIWDRVFISFTGPIRVARSLCLPDVKDKKVTIKLLLQNHDKKIKREFSLETYPAEVSVFIREKKSDAQVSEIHNVKTNITCLTWKEIDVEIPFKEFHLWSPSDPFLYEAVINISSQGKPSDRFTDTFGMRDFKPRGKYFFLNGNEIKLLGSNITLSRFFSDPERADLPWNKKWVKKLLIEIPKALRWNVFRNSIGLLPDFWYELADEYGILIQNEWAMWKNRGWNREIDKEYTDWIWSDGSHPSIVIWDAMNESRQEYIGNVIIPKLEKLDPTRIWDAGYMDETDMKNNEMDEVHCYPLLFSQRTSKEKVEREREGYRFGNFQYEKKLLSYTKYKSVPQLLNEYAWLWLNRDGTPAFISKGMTDENDVLPKKHYYRPLNEWKDKKARTIGLFEYYLGTNKDTTVNRNFQAYYIELQTEAMRTISSLCGVMSFSYLTYNKGFTGDWFLNPIKDLKPSSALKWQIHCFSLFAVFIDEEDGRYLKNPKTFDLNKTYCIKLIEINDTNIQKEGKVVLKLLNAEGKIISSASTNVKVQPHDIDYTELKIKTPGESGGYLLVSELTDNNDITQVSRRFIRIGDAKGNVKFPEYKINLPPNWPE